MTKNYWISPNFHRFNSILILRSFQTGVLENFKDENGKFFCNLTGDKRVRSMLSLLRASEISFPGEKVMQEAKAFTREYLTQVLAGRGDVTDVDQSLLREVSDKYFFKVSGKNDTSCVVVLSVHSASSKAWLDFITLLQVKYALEFPWHCSVPRWEARNFIEICGQNDLWLK